MFWNAPALILICAAKDQPETDWDAVRAAQNLMISAHARGLGACWVGSPMAWLRSPEGARRGRRAGRLAPVAPMLVGYSGGDAATAAGGSAAHRLGLTRVPDP